MHVATVGRLYVCSRMQVDTTGLALQEGKAVTAAATRHLLGTGSSWSYAAGQDHTLDHNETLQMTHMHGRACCTFF
jgi:hypothetical protein